MTETERDRPTIEGGRKRERERERERDRDRERQTDKGGREEER